MQLAKDTFYVTLRNAITFLNPSRSMVIRGVVRPGVLVEENELESAVVPADAFCLRWMDAGLDTRGALTLLIKLRCEIHYETAGSTTASGMDRGRALAEMDRELVMALCGEIQSTPKMDFSTGLAAPSGTRIFWSDPVFSSASVAGDRLKRSAAVEVWSYEEAGEL